MGSTDDTLAPEDGAGKPTNPATRPLHGGRCRRALDACGVCRTAYPDMGAAYAAMGDEEREYLATPSGMTVAQRAALYEMLPAFEPVPWSLGAAFDYFTADQEERTLPGVDQPLDATALLADGGFFDQHTLAFYSPFEAGFPALKRALDKPAVELGTLGADWGIDPWHLSLVQHVAGALDLYIRHVRASGDARRERAIFNETLHQLARFGKPKPNGAASNERRAAAVRILRSAGEWIESEAMATLAAPKIQFQLGLVDEKFRELALSDLAGVIGSLAPHTKGGAGNRRPPAATARLALQCGALGCLMREGEAYEDAVVRVERDFKVAVSKTEKPSPAR
jgi:hypothetical protein